MTGYLIFAALIVALLVVFGIPAITRQVKIPLVLRAVELAAEDLSEQARELFRSQDAAAGDLGFKPLKNFSVPGLARGNENRLYLNAAESTALLVTVAAASADRPVILEFCTAFPDGVELCTSNAPVSTLFDQPDWHQVCRRPALTRLADLYEVHRRRVSERLAQGAAPRALLQDRLLDELLRNQIRQMEHQVQQGLLRLDETDGVYVATPKIALRGIINFLNPLADDFTPQRFVLAVGPALGLLLAAILLAPRLGLPDLLRQLFPAGTDRQINFLLYCPGFLLAGLVVGYLFPQKGFLWGLLLSLPGVILLPAAVSSPVFYSLLAAWAGQTANRFRQSRDSGLSAAQSFTGLLVLAALVVIGYYYAA